MKNHLGHRSSCWTVFLLDDDPEARASVRRLIETERDLDVCGEAASTGAAFDLVQRLNPDLLLADVSLRSGSSGLDLIRRIKSVRPRLPILVMSPHDEDIYAERALRAGAMGYVMKHELPYKGIPAVRRVLDGEIYVADTVKDRMVHRLVAKHPATATFPIDTLSEREMQVFRLLGDGYSTRQVAEKLGLSIKTIDSYREHLKLKLNLPDGTTLVKHAIQWVRTESMI